MMYEEQEQQPYGNMQRSRTQAVRGMRKPPPAYESNPNYGDVMPSWRESEEQKLFRRLREMFGMMIAGPQGPYPVPGPGYRE